MQSISYAKNLKGVVSPQKLNISHGFALYEIMSGQHRTNAGFEFVLGPKAVELEWLAMFGSQIIPQVV